MPGPTYRAPVRHRPTLQSPEGGAVSFASRADHRGCRTLGGAQGSPFQLPESAMLRLLKPYNGGED